MAIMGFRRKAKPDIRGVAASGCAGPPAAWQVNLNKRTPELERAHLAIRHPPAGRQRVRPAQLTLSALLGAGQAYLDGELCGVGPNGITSFSIIQLASDSGNAAALVFFLFDLLYIDGEDLSLRTLIERKDRLAVLLANVSAPLHYFDHQIGHGRAFFEKACAMSLEGIVSKRTD